MTARGREFAISPDDDDLMEWYQQSREDEEVRHRREYAVISSAFYRGYNPVFELVRAIVLRLVKGKGEVK